MSAPKERTHVSFHRFFWPCGLEPQCEKPLNGLNWVVAVQCQSLDGWALKIPSKFWKSWLKWIANCYLRHQSTAMKAKNTDGYYKPLLIAIALGKRSGSLTHTCTCSACTHVHLSCSTPILSCCSAWRWASLTANISYRLSLKHELPYCCRSREVKTSCENKHTHKNPQQERTSQP